MKTPSNTDKKRTIPVALTVAGSDSGGGAGIQADLRTFQLLGVYGLSAITSVTAQNTLGVRMNHHLPASVVLAQVQAVWEDMGADAVKIGMLGTGEVVRMLAAFLQTHNHNKGHEDSTVIPVILDPVLVSTSGMPLLDGEGISNLIQLLLPQVTLVTPNLLEAGVLCQRQIPPFPTEMDLVEACRAIHRLGPPAVLLKGGHLPGDHCDDCLYTRDEKGQELIRWYREKRISTPNSHGTGCVLASAITAFLLRKGVSLGDAVALAKAHVMEGLLGGQDLFLGKGKGPLFHRPPGDI